MSATQRLVTGNLTLLWKPGDNVVRREDDHSVFYELNHIPEKLQVLTYDWAEWTLLSDRRIMLGNTIGGWTLYYEHYFGLFDDASLIETRNKGRSNCFYLFMWQDERLGRFRMHNSKFQRCPCISFPPGQSIKVVQESYFSVKQGLNGIKRRAQGLSVDPDIEILTESQFGYHFYRLYGLPDVAFRCTIPKCSFETNLAIWDKELFRRVSFAFQLTDKVKLLIIPSPVKLTDVLWFLDDVYFKPILLPFLDNREEIVTLLGLRVVQDLPWELTELILTYTLPPSSTGRLDLIQQEEE